MGWSVQILRILSLKTIYYAPMLLFAPKIWDLPTSIAILFVNDVTSISKICSFFVCTNMSSKCHTIWTGNIFMYLSPHSVFDKITMTIKACTLYRQLLWYQPSCDNICTLVEKQHMKDSPLSLRSLKDKVLSRALSISSHYLF